MSTHYQVLVIGGGINGAGVAQAAAAAGYSVLLLEKTRFAAGTSSRSSKLIHGGLRYLETLELSLVRESLHERSLMLRLAPKLVRLQRFFIPVYAETRRRPWQLRTGLSLYALLSAFREGSDFGTVPVQQWDELDGLRKEGLQNVFYFHDAQTDDRALTCAVVDSAERLGAVAHEHAEFEHADMTSSPVTVRYRHEGTTRQVTADVLVNAAGPWINGVMGRITPSPATLPVELVQGSHIVVTGEIRRGCYYMESRRDGRAVFVMPWQGRTLVGTTETRFTGDPDNTAPLQSERHYLSSILTHHFPRYRAAVEADEIEAFAGLRVLPTGEGHAFHRSREVILLEDRKPAPRLVSIYGGKLTTWRATALKVMRRFRRSLPEQEPVADTAELRLHPPAAG